MFSTPEGSTTKTSGRRHWAQSRLLGITARPALGLSLLLAVMTLSTTTGCSHAPLRHFQWDPPAQPEPANARIEVDPAMEHRSWPESHAYWANGTVVGGPTRFPYTYRTFTDTAEYRPYLLDTFVFIYEVIRLPFTYFVDPPFTPKAYKGVQYSATYTAAPRIESVTSGDRRHADAPTDYGAISPAVLPSTMEPTATTTRPATLDGARPTTLEGAPGAEPTAPATRPAQP